ncbi:PIN domain-containing protein [Nostoc sp. CHAB 5834]|nr:PIN domain-containing protein [Nostoc sp. CHAB 5834]
MKNIFQGSIKKSVVEVEELWQNGLITFDTNVFLNLYRYSNETRNEIIKIMRLLSSRLFLTNQVTIEFNKNRLNNIADQLKSLDDFSKNMIDTKEKLMSKVSHPFISPLLLDQFNNNTISILKEIESTKEFYNSILVKDDTILNELISIFEDKVDEGYDEKKTLSIINEGKTRYDNNIPPGYKDKKKDDSSKYGDLIIWFQIIDKAKKEKKPIIFVTEDNKEDWWLFLKNGMIFGPRQELIQEIWIKSGVMFHMYSIENFIEHSSKYLEITNNEVAIEEIRNFESEQVQKEFINQRNQHSFYIPDEKKSSYIYKSHIEQILERYDELKKLLENIENQLDIQLDIKLRIDEEDMSSKPVSNNQAIGRKIRKDSSNSVITRLIQEKSKLEDQLESMVEEINKFYNPHID